MKLGILAGTFDPVHAGHLVFAKAAISQFNLDKVLLMPERRPRHKTDVIDFADRLAMLELAAEGESRLEVFTTDEANFSLDATLDAVMKKYPNQDIVILLGSDVAKKLSRWNGLENLDDSVSFIVAQRQGSGKLARTPHVHLEWLSFEVLPLTSSQVRSHQSSSGLPAVDSYIAEHRLYR